MSGILWRSKKPLVAALMLMSAAASFGQDDSTSGNNGAGAAFAVFAGILVWGVIIYSLYRAWKRRSSKSLPQAKNFAQRFVSEKVATITPEWLKTSLKDAPTQLFSTKPAGKSIFISYRRQDSAHITGRIYDALTARFGKSAVFKDVDSMPLGYDFRNHIREQVGRCAVLVAVIGKNWLGPLASGERRLNDQRDHLRLEIEAALERHIPVIPVLVDGVEMPTEEELPPSLASLVYRHGIAVRPDPDFHNDADRLARGIEPLLK